MEPAVPPPRAATTTDYIAIRRQLGKGHNAVVYLVDYNTDPIPRAMKKIARNNKRTENMNRLRANNPARAGSHPPLPRTNDGPTALVDRRGTEEAKIRREIAIMKKCDHPNIIKFFSFIDDQSSANICLIMEYMEGGELQWHNESGGPYLTMDQTRRCTRDVVLGLQYLHKQGIIHRDIKPSNIMWTADRSHVKIGDFGVAHLVQSTAPRAPNADPDLDADMDSAPRHAGTPAFLAPEIAPGADPPPAASFCASPSTSSSPLSPSAAAAAAANAVTPAVDLWALGVTLFCMLFGCMPFDAAPDAKHAGPVAAEASLYRAIRTEPWRVPEGVATLCANRVPIEGGEGEGKKVLTLLGRLLEKDVSRRWGTQDVKDAPWLLRGVQRRAEWRAATTPAITVSAADEANAILEPKFKWNLKGRMGLGRRFSNFFRGWERDAADDAADGTGAVRSEPWVRERRPRPRETGREKERDKDTAKDKRMKPKSRSVDTARQPLPPPPAPSTTASTSSQAGDSPSATRRALGFFRRGAGRESPLPPPAGGASGNGATAGAQPPTAVAQAKRRLGVFPPAARHSADALHRPARSSARVHPGAPPIKTAPADLAHAGRASGSLGSEEYWSGDTDGQGYGVDGEGDGEGVEKVMIVGAVVGPAVVGYRSHVPRPSLPHPDARRPDEKDAGAQREAGLGSPGSASASGSGCSYGAGARGRDESYPSSPYADDDDDDEEERDPYADDDDYDDDDLRPRVDMYDSTSSGDEDGEQPIEFRGGRRRAGAPVPSPLPASVAPTSAPENGHEPPPDSDTEPEDGGGKAGTDGPGL